MRADEPMGKVDRRFAWGCVGISFLGPLLLMLHFDDWGITVPFPLLLITVPLSMLAVHAVIISCYEDLSRREFRDRNTKMRWANAFAYFGPAIPIYLLYFGYVLARRERSKLAAGQRTSFEGDRSKV
ncbi:MAG: hypothetical protein AAGG48_25620 [Planctomycetota bacterium]